MTRRAQSVLLGICSVVYLLIATRGGTGLTRTQFGNKAFSDFFDIQAGRFLDARLSVPPNSIGLEAFVIDGAHHMYFGVFPALLRVPIQLAGNAWFGELTVISSFFAWLMFTLSAWALGQQIYLDRLGALRPISGSSAVMNLWRLATALGSPMLMLAGPAWVFSEAIMWGVATATFFQWRLYCELRNSSSRNQILAIAASLLAALNRPTLGIGCILALFLVAGWRSRHRLTRVTIRLGLGAVASLAALVGPNMLRFGRLYGPPMEQQLLSQVDPQRQAMLEYNGGRFVDFRYLPTNLLAYLRPDGMGISDTFPFLEAPHRIPSVLGGAVYDITYRTPSVTAGMTLLFVAGLIGTISLLRTRRKAVCRRVSVVTVAGVPAVATILTWGFIAPRYLADFVVALVPLSAFGAASLTERVARQPSTAMRQMLATTLSMIAAWSIVANVGLALSSSYLTGPDGGAKDLIRLQGRDDYWDSPDSQRLNSASDFSSSRTSPPTPGMIAILGNCEAAYLSTGEPVDPWLTLDYGPNNFRRTFLVTAPTEPISGSVHIASMGAAAPVHPGDPTSFRLDLVNDSNGSVGLDLSDEYGTIHYPLFNERGAQRTVSITADPVRQSLYFEVDGRTAHFGHYLLRSLFQSAPPTITFTDGGDDGGLRVERAPGPEQPCV